MTEPREAAIAYAHRNQERFLEDLKEFISIPSISTDPERKGDLLRAAEWVASHLRHLGVDCVKVMPTGGHPVVYGEYLKAGQGAKTVLVYGHYDVQPAEPLELWDSAPFVAQRRGESLYARGSSDMKGQVVAALAAIEGAMSNGALPVNLKFLIEGEEEIGSPNLATFIAAHKDLLACDLAFNPDTGMLAPDLPTITYALRGMAYFELRVYGPSHDLHSGLYGGVVHNPAQVLCELVAAMHDEKGRVTLPGFYDPVRPLDAEERQELARLPTTEAFYLEQTGVKMLWGEAGYTPVERTGARPTLEVNGLYSGFTGEGSKTVLPAWAMAKISCRLVPDQNPERVFEQFRQYIEAHAPKTVRYEVFNLVGGQASISDRNSDGVRAVCRALEHVWGKRPVFRREGGSVPVVAQFQTYLGVESVNFGFGLPDDNAHGPNEKLHLPTWQRGIDAIIHALYNLGEG
jgi:acetylornithine deacetylase/succinyl-diaminopimelate desuccinylase-like protein